MKSPNKVDSTSTSIEIPFEPPKGYHYEVTEHKRNVVAVWLCGGPRYLYKDGETARTIHSFHNTKKGTWYAPVNSKKAGDEVRLNQIRPWTAMQLNLNPLEQLLFG